MEKSFANLLRYSRLATYDHTLEQVYKSPKSYRKIGDWGLKRNLPTVIQTKNLIVKALDTAEHQTPWQSGNSKVLFLKRWKENFPNSRKPRPRSEEERKINVAQMSPAQFQRLLKSVEKTKAREFQEKLERKEVVPDQVFDYINVTFNMNEIAAAAAITSPSSATNNTAPSTSDSMTTGDGVVGPTYSHYEVSMDRPVDGRILNVINDKYAVGIGGVVAYMDKRRVLGYNNSDRKKQQFYIQHAEIDESGRPDVEVTLDKDSNWPSSIFSEEVDAFHSRDRNTNRNNSSNLFSNNHNKMNARDIQTDDDNIKENDGHTRVMDRINRLLVPSQK